MAIVTSAKKIEDYDFATGQYSIHSTGSLSQVNGLQTHFTNIGNSYCYRIIENDSQIQPIPFNRTNCSNFIQNVTYAGSLVKIKTWSYGVNTSELYFSATVNAFSTLSVFFWNRFSGNY